MARDLTPVLDYYRDLLLYQYVRRETPRAHIGVVVGAALCDLVPLDVADGFAIETAVGLQLDMIGRYLGFPRIVNAPVERQYFTFVDYADPQVVTGFTAYDNSTNAGSVFFRYAATNQSLIELQDDEYRRLLQFKVIRNISDNTLASIQSLLYGFFSTDVVMYDNADMSFSYVVKPTLNRITTLALNLGLLPKPMGVRITGVTIADDPTNP